VSPGTSKSHIEIVSQRLTPIHLEPLSERPLVSILTSNYNYADFLPEAADSVLGQTYSKYEWIICDDGSTDRSPEVLHELACFDSRIRFVPKDNGGQASGLNVAFSNCSGELIFLLDSDDVYHPTKLEIMVHAHQSDPSAGFGLHRVQWVNNARARQGVWPPPGRIPAGWHGEDMLNNGGVLPYMPPTSGLSIHRSVGNRIFPLPETPELTGVADQVITRLAPLLTRILRRQEVLAEYRVHGNNSYIRNGTDADSIFREITTCRNLWSAQRDFVDGLGHGVATRLQPIETSSYMIYLRYLYSRLSGSVDQHLRYERLMDQLETGRPFMNFFWKYSLHLPIPLFAAIVSFISKPSLLKQILARLRTLT
jgi:glycosyltransferase involved in cell wall biosynthesis